MPARRREYFCRLTLLLCKSKQESISISNMYSNYFSILEPLTHPNNCFITKIKQQINLSFFPFFFFLVSLVDGRHPLRPDLFWGLRVAMKNVSAKIEVRLIRHNKQLCARERQRAGPSQWSVKEYALAREGWGVSRRWQIYLFVTSFISFSFSANSWFVLWIKQLANIRETVCTGV